MAGSIIWKHFRTNKYIPIGIFSSAANFIADINKTKDFADNPTSYEGLTYYDTTLNQLRTWDGSTWSPAGMSGTSSGALNSAASIGTKITIDGSTVASTIEIECSDNGLSSGALLLLDNNDTTNDPVCLDIDNDANAAGAVSIDIDGTAGYDIQGTSDTWHVTYQGYGKLTRLDFDDDALIRFGSSQDMTLGWDATQLEFIPAATDSAVVFGDGDPRIDVKIWGANTNSSILFDASANKAIFNGYDIELQDDDILNFGDSDDVTITWNQSNLLIEAATDNTGQIRLGSTNSMDLAIYGSTNSKIALWDVDTAILELNGWDVNLQDDDILQFGDSNDITIVWDQTDLLIDGAAADTVIKIGATNNQDVVIYGATASNLITFDTDDSALECIFDNFDLRMKDDDYILFGNSAAAGSAVDNTIRYDSSGDVLEIVGGVLFEDDVQIGESGATNTLTVYGEVTVTGNVSWSTGGSASFALGDSEAISFGTGTDVSIQWDATNLLIEPVAEDTGQIRIGSTNGMDLAVYGSTNTNIALFDASTAVIELNGWDINLQDDDYLYFGDANDITIQWIGTSSTLNVEGAAANNSIIFGASTNVDVTFTGAAANAVWDASDDSLELGDGAILAFGASDDVEIKWDGSASTLNIEGGAANKAIVVGGTNVCDLTLNGGTAGRDVLWDASDNSMEFADNAILAFGSADDVEITWDGSSSTLDFNGGAADNQIRFGDPTNVDLVICGGTTTNAITYDTDDSALSCTFNGFDLILQDDDLLKFGDAPDVTITWTGSSSALYVDAAAADRAINVGYTNNMDLVIHGGTTGSEVTFDTDDSALLCIFDGFDLRMNDDDLIYFGDASDLSITWTGSSSALYVDAAAADRTINFGYTNNMDLVIHGGTTGSEVTFDTDDSALLCIFDGFDLRLNDDDILKFGDDSDFTFTFDSTNSVLVVEGGTADTVIAVGKSTNLDLVIYGDTSTDAVTFDTSAEDVQFNGFDLTLQDDDIINFGDADDVTITWTGSSSALYVDAAAADRAINVGYTNNMDLVIHAATTGSEVTFDTDDSAKLCIFDGFDLRMNDDDILQFGDSNDITMVWDQTQFNIDGGVADKNIRIGYTNNQDVTIYAESTAAYVVFDTDDTTGKRVTFEDFDLKLMDDDSLMFGDASTGDINMVWNQTDFLIEGTADNKILIGKTNNLDIVIYGDTSTDAVTFDTSAESCVFDGFDLTMNDADIIKFGDAGADGTLASDGTNIDWTITAALTLGDGGTTNYTQITSNGSIQQFGSAELLCFKRNIIACGTTEAYTIAATDSGAVFCTTGATDAVVFTLPTIAAGLNYKFCNTVDQNMQVASSEGDNMVIMNDASADTVSFATAGEKIGGSCEVICDGTKWLVFMTNWADDAVSQTFTTTT